MITLGPYSTARVEVDGRLPIVRDRLSIAAGIAYGYQEFFPGEDERSLQLGAVLRWTPADNVEVKSFYGRSKVIDDLTIPSIFTAGPYLPPKIERRNFGLDIFHTDADRQFYGSVASVRLSRNWQVRAGLFRSDSDTSRSAAELFRNVQPDGSAQRQLVSLRNQSTGSTSGELRSSYSIVEGGRQHTLHLAARGRRTNRTFGGADVRNLGPATIGERIEVPEPDYAFKPQSHDRVRQVTGGIGYEMRWPGVAELSLGLQKSDYEKNSFIPDRPTLTTKDKPWLFNGTLAVHVTDKLVAYAGYTRGLEESGTAPANAVNRNEAPPALKTSQRDAGIRFVIMPRLSLIAGVFDVRKPYFNLDPEFVYRELGVVRHRGIELSLAGQPVEGLSLVAGAVLLNADVSGEAVDLGSIGPKPVGTSNRIVRANLDYRLPSFDAMSVDLGVTHEAGQVASAGTYAELGGRQLMTEPQALFDIGARYRFKLGTAPATLRLQITNVFDTYRWKVGGNSSFRFIDERRFILRLAADF